MKNCKVCDEIRNSSNPELARDISSSLSSRKLSEKWGVIGKTVINKHRAQCDTGMPNEADLQSVEWTGPKGILNTGTLDAPLTGLSHDEILKEFGHDPEQVEIQGLLREKHQQYWSRDLSKMLWKHTYSYGLAKKQDSSPEIDVMALVREMKLKAIAPKSIESGDSTFVLDWADWQTGKQEGGGTPAFIKRFDGAMMQAVERIKELRKIGRSIDELLIIGGGDMIEGCTIYPNQSFHIDMHRREQIRFTVATIMKGIHLLAPMFSSVRVVVAPGNHGENRINGKKTSTGDNDDLLVFEMAQLGIGSDSNMNHVSFDIAEEEESITTEVRGWTYGITHGSIYGRGAGNVRNKVFNWFKIMAANRHEIGKSDVLVTHHFHHDACEDWGKTLWVQSPAMDGGSSFFKEMTGHDAKSGMLSWVATTSSRFQDKQILW